MSPSTAISGLPDNGRRGPSRSIFGTTFPLMALLAVTISLSPVLACPLGRNRAGMNSAPFTRFPTYTVRSIQLQQPVVRLRHPTTTFGFALESFSFNENISLRSSGDAPSPSGSPSEIASTEHLIRRSIQEPAGHGKILAANTR